MFCPRCGTANLDDSVYCTECGTNLEARCSACGVDNPPGSRFCRKCGEALAESPARPVARTPAAYTPRHLTEKILTSRSALEGERKLVTVLFADVKGSVELARSVDAEVWHGLLDRYFAILSDGIHRFEGTINQYTGDGIMALFGAPIAHEDHAQRACFAALHLQGELASFSAELRRTQSLNFSVRMGLNSGEVVVGRIGDDLRMDYTAQGQTVGLAARMEQLAEPGKTYLTKATAALVSGFFRLKDLGRFSVKGEPRAIRVYELQGLGEMRTRFDVARERGFSRFIGRAQELGALESSLTAALEGRGAVVSVVSEAGLGKSRLCWEFAERCRARGLTVLGAGALPHGRATPFLPILEILRGCFEIVERDEPAAAREKVAGKLVLLDESFRDSLPLIFELLRVPDAARPAPRMDPDARRRQFRNFVRDLLRARSRREPLVVIAEDLQWFDAASEMIVGDLVRHVPDTRILLVLNWRPDYAPPWRAVSPVTEITLAPLAPEATRELARELLGDDPSVAELAERIAERSAGNPLFIEEAVHSLAATRALKGRDGEYRRVGPVEEIEIPATVQAILDARIDALEEREKLVLQAAAVIGKEFPAPVLQRVLGFSADELDAALATLCELQFLWPPKRGAETVYSFRHALTQEVAYRSQLVQRRKQAHGEVARIIEALYPERADEEAAVIARHWEEAGDPLAAVRWYQRAARWIGTNDPAESLRHWRKVRSLQGEIAETAETLALGVMARVQILNLCWRLGVPEDEVAAIFKEAKDLAERSGNLDAVVGICTLHGVVQLNAGEIRDATLGIEEAERLAERSENRELRLSLHTALVYTYSVAGRLRDSLAKADEALAWTGDDPAFGAAYSGISPYIFLTGFRGSLYIQMGRLADAAAALDRARAASREIGELEVRGWIHSWYVNLAAASGETAAVLEDARQGLEIAEKTGSPFSRVVAYSQLGRAHALEQGFDEAIRAYEKALGIARERRTGLGSEGSMVAGLAEAHLGQGAARRASDAVKEALTIARRRGERADECYAHVVLARVLLKSEGARAKRPVLKALEAADELARKTGAALYLPFIHRERAELARLTGEDEILAGELTESLRLFEEIGATAHAAAVRAQLPA